MAKPKFDFEDKQNLLRIEGWARDGATDKQIAENIGYSEPYFCELKGKISELSEALKKGRAPLDFIVETNLYKKAIGMTVNVQQAIKVKEVYYDEEGRRCSTEEIKVVDVEQFIPPDTTAQIFWLRNRKPKQWNNEVNKVDMTSNGKDFNPQIQVEIIDSRSQIEDTNDKDLQ